MATRLAEQKSTMKPVKPELGASSLFGDIASHVKETPVELGGKPTLKEVIDYDSVVDGSHRLA
jgi:hypothetical protein